MKIMKALAIVWLMSFSGELSFGAAEEPNREPASSLETKKEIADQGFIQNEQEPTRLIRGPWRQQLTDAGFEWDAFYFWNGISNHAGGLKKGAMGLSTFDIFLHVDFEKLLGWEGGSFHLHHHTNIGKSIGNYTGDLAGVNSYALPSEESLLSQAYLRQTWGEGTWDWLLGLYDFSSEFAVTDSSLIFMNNGFLLGAEMYPPSPAGLSVYPINAMATRLRWVYEKSIYAMLGFASSTPRDPNFTNGTHPRVGSDEGYYQILELGLQSEYNKEILNKFAFGVWGFTNDFDEIGNAGKTDKDVGYYAVVDYHFTERLGAFFRLGQANKKVSTTESSAALGVNYSDLIVDGDQVGIGYAQTSMSAVERERLTQSGTSRAPSETVFELVYRIEPIPGVIIMPDFQKVFYPSMSKGVKDAVVSALRLELSF